MFDAQAITRAVATRRDEIVEFLRQVVRIPSVTGQEAEVGAVIADKLRELGIEVRVVEAIPGRPNVLGIWSGAPGPRLVFNGHMDVVPPGPSDEWEVDPWSAELVGDRIYGRGTVDMKSGLCASIMAVAVLKDMGFHPRGSVLLTCVCDEEVGGKYGTCYLLENGLIQGDFGINCEATNRRIEIAHKGILRATVTVRGKAIHGSRPWLGVDAIEKAVRAINELYAHRDVIKSRRHALLGYPTLVVGTVHGGTCPNMIPSKCEFTVDRRLIPGETHDSAEAEIADILERLAREDPEFRAAMEITNRRPILDVPEDSVVVRALKESVRELTGAEPEVGGKDAGTDASLIMAATGMPMPIYGPGNYLRGSLAPNEYVEVDDLLLATRVYALSIVKLLG